MRSTGRGAIALVVAAILIGGWLGSSRRPHTPVVAETATTIVSDLGAIRVHVAGWVVSPGVVVVPEGAIVADAVEAAGGLRIGAVSTGINLAAPITEGAQVIVPGPGSQAGGAEHAGDGLVALNSASSEELEGLPGVGPVLAERIVDHRERNGPFQRVEDLLLVPGIGEAKLASIRDLVRVP